MNARPENRHLGYEDTPVLEESGFRVHDGTRPQPPVVAPADAPGGPPADAVVLFDGTGLGGWVSSRDGSPADWKVENGFCEVVPGTGDIRTERELGSRLQLHVEFASPAEVRGDGQGRGNSGIFLMDRYEIQVLDNFRNPTYPDGTVGAVYGQFPPLANPLRGPGEWNAFDICWEGPVFEGGALREPARVTVFLNGVLVQAHRRLLGATTHRELPRYEPHPARAPLRLQDHGDAVRFRSIWAREFAERV